MSHDKPYFQGRYVDDEHEMETCNRRRFVFWLSLILSFVIAGFIVSAHAGEIPVHVMDKDGVTVRLMPGPCADGTSMMLVLQLVPPQFHDRFKAIDSEWPHKDGTKGNYPGCWAEFSAEESGQPEAGFFVAFSDGAHGFIPKSAFLKVRGQSGA